MTENEIFLNNLEGYTKTTYPSGRTIFEKEFKDFKVSVCDNYFDHLHVIVYQKQWWYYDLQRHSDFFIHRDKYYNLIELYKMDTHAPFDDESIKLILDTYCFEYPSKDCYGFINKGNFSLAPLHISGGNTLCGYLISYRENSTNIFHVVRNGEQLLRWLNIFNIK